MITVKEWMEIVDYKISECVDFDWQYYGSNAYSLHSWRGKHREGYNFIVFDGNTQEVYETQVHDYLNNRAYRMINPNYAQRHLIEDVAWDEISYTDLIVDADFIQKALEVLAESHVGKVSASGG